MAMFAALSKRHLAFRSLLCIPRVQCSELLREKSTTAALDQGEQSSKQIRDIPGPTLIESLTRLVRERFRYHHVFVEEMFQRYGPIFRHSLPGNEIVYVSDPKDIEKVYVSQEDHNPYRGDILLAQCNKARGLDMGILGDDESWYPHRQLLAPKLLRRGALQPYFDEVLNVVDDSIASLREGRNEDLKACLSKFAAESIGVILFGLRLGTNHESPNEKAMAFIEAVNGYFDTEAKLMLGIPLHKYISTPKWKEAFRCYKKQLEITAWFAEESRNAKTELAKTSLAYRLENEDNVADKDTVTAICSNLFLGGIQTTATSVTQFVDVLAKHPEVQEKAYEEIQRIVGDKRPTFDDLAEMPYLKALLKEFFRYTGTPLGNKRDIKAPLTLRGYHIPPGSKVIICNVGSKEMQEEKYGNPDKFAPERWLPNAEKRIHAFSNTPFSFGRRSCPGKRVVEMEVSLLFLRLIQKYKLLENKLPADQVDWIFQLMATPDKPYAFCLKERN